MPRTPEYSGAYGDAGRLNSALTLIDTDQLLREIPDNIKSKVLIKAYLNLCQLILMVMITSNLPI